MTKQILTQEYLKSLFRYDPDTGVITHRISRRGVSAGSVAGTINSNGYRVIGVDWKVHKAHRLAWLIYYGELPECQIDHVNRIRTDNRIENLRAVTSQENLRNQKLHKNNKSGVCGVIWRKKIGKWNAHIMIDYKQVNLGHYSDWWDAVCARKAADSRYEFHTNHGR